MDLAYDRLSDWQADTPPGTGEANVVRVKTQSESEDRMRLTEVLFNR